MSTTDWEDSVKNDMFMKLFKYIVGVNEDNEEVERARPITTKFISQRRSRAYDEEMCFWLGNGFRRKDPPKPLDRQVYIVDREKMNVFVR